jgi:1-deoxyxylulose-5-phosphate synthase
LQYRKLGNSDLELSVIGLGSWLTYGVGVDDGNGRACVQRAFDEGINFIDTANVYGRGAAEEFLGDVLQGRDRSGYVLATKLFFPMDSHNSGLSAQQIRKQSEDSLRRLRTDHIDLYQCHRFDSHTPLEETMTALTELVESGKVRYVGFSEWPVEAIRAAREIPGVVHFVSSQPEYSMLQRRIEAAVIPECERQGVGQVVWSPLGQGVLTGKYMPGQTPPADSRATNQQMNGWIGDWLADDDLLQAVQDLRPIAEEHDLSLAQLALAWVLRQPNVTSAIIGASRPEQVSENCRAAGVVLDEKTLLRIDETVRQFARR